MSGIQALITRSGPGYMYDVELYDKMGRRIPSYGTVCYTLRGARSAAKRRIIRAERDLLTTAYREVIRP